MIKDKDFPLLGNDEAQAIRFREMLKRTGMKQAEFARTIDMKPTTVSRWATGWQRPPGIVWAYLELKARVKELNG
jgi:DNA-binding transcriptional regulator YiaG